MSSGHTAAARVLAAGLRVAAWLLCALAQVAGADTLPATSAQGHVFQYLYVDANEDQASGGHAAVRLDDEVFHFQFQQGRLMMSRDRWGEFQLAYRGYQNRTIFGTRVVASDDTYDLLRRSFVRRYLTQNGQLERQRDAQADLDLLLALRQRPAAPVTLPGLGFFERSGDAGRSNGDNQQRLRQLLLEAYGADFLQRRRTELQRALRELPVAAVDLSDQDFSPGRLPSPQYPFHARYADLVGGLRALEVLEGGESLSSEALALEDFAPAEFTLIDADRALLGVAIEGLEGRLVRLAGSARPDWGQAMLLGMARLAALQISLERGQWVFLNILDDGAAEIRVGPHTRELLPRLQADSQAVWRAEREQWLSRGVWSEIYYGHFESSAAAWLELRRVEASGNSHWRVRDTDALPRGPGLLPAPPVPLAVQRDGEALTGEMRRVAAEAEALSEQNLSYDLLTRNCVSELFVTIDLAMADALRRRGVEASSDALAAEYLRRIGVRFEPSPIPFASSRQVRRHWWVRSATEMLSLRRIYVAEQRAQRESPWVSLRETNAFSSSVYERSDGDSFFVFFTDEDALWRPVAGLVNLTAAVGMSAVGVFQAPFDRGRNLKAGLKGALFSLPELGFQNIRKGTSTWLPEPLRELELSEEP